MDIICSLLLTLIWQGNTQTIEWRVQGKMLENKQDTYVVDFSEELKDLPVLDGNKTYSKVELPKNKCEEYK